MRSVTMFQHGLSCLCARMYLASARPTSLWPSVGHLGQADHLGVQVYRNSSFGAHMCIKTSIGKAHNSEN